MLKRVPRSNEVFPFSVREGRDAIMLIGLPIAQAALVLCADAVQQNTDDQGSGQSACLSPPNQIQVTIVLFHLTEFARALFRLKKQ